MPTASVLRLHEGDRARLEALTRMSTAPAGLVQRARIILLAARGLSNTEVAAGLGVSRPTVLKWRTRYERAGIGSLEDLPRPGRPVAVDETAVLVATLADGGRPPARLGVARWSSRLLAAELGVAHSTVFKVWRRWGVQPQLSEPFHPPTVPALEPGTREVVGLCLVPPWNVVVVKAGQQLGVRPGIRSGVRPGAQLGVRPGRRPGTRLQPLSPAVRTRPVRDPAAAPSPPAAFLSFLETVAAAHPHTRLLVVVDGWVAPHSPRIRAWLARNTHVTVHRTTAECSWLTLTQVLLGSIGRASFRSGTFEAVPAMRDSLRALLDIPLSSWHDHAAPSATAAGRASAGPGAGGVEGGGRRPFPLIHPLLGVLHEADAGARPL